MFVQIIRRARHTYLLDRYIKAQPSLGNLMSDITEALQVYTV